MAILWGLIGLFGLVLAFVLGGGLGEKAGPNAHLAARMKGLNKEGRFEEVLAMEKQADLSDEPTMRLVQDQLDLARNSLRAKRISVLEKKSEEYLLWQIQKWQQDNRRDAEGLIRRYDEYLERFPGTAHWKSVADRREQLAGAPSPVYLRMVADGTLDRIPPETPAPDPGALTIGQRLRLAAEEADGLVEGRRFSAAMEVYGALLRDHVSGLPEFEQAPYRAEVQKRMDKIEKAAYKAFELLEQEAFTLSETGRLDEAESLYRTALETYGLGPIRDRCRVELERIAGMRGR